MKPVSEFELQQEAVRLFRKDYSNAITQAGAGALVYSSSQASNQILVLLSGSVRLIDSRKTFNSLTLAKIEAPNVLGVHHLLATKCPIEIRALTTCKILLLNIDNLSKAQQNAASRVLLSHINLSECGLIISALEQARLIAGDQFQSAADVKKAFEILTPEKLNHRQTILYLDKERDGFSYAQVITAEICQRFFKATTWPRLAAAELSAPRPENATPQATEQESTKPEGITEAQQLEAIPITPELKPEQNSTSDDGFRIIKGSNRKEAFASCISMLVQFYQLPTRRDTIARAADILETSVTSTGSNPSRNPKTPLPWLGRLLSILDELGLAVRMVRVQSDRPFRVPSPSAWVDAEGHAVLITRTNARSLTVIDPREGRQEWDFTKAKNQFASQPQLISVDIGLHTPRKQFGLSWLIPYVKRYRLQLIEVFSASFLNQLFALATPLLFQQIIDRVISKGAFDALGPLVILMLIFVALETIFSALRTFQFVEVSNRIDIGVGSAIVSRLLRINARFFDRRPVGELASRLGELENIRRFLTGTALTVVLDAFFALLYFAVMFFYSPLLTMVIILTLPLLFGVTLGVTPITQRLIRARAEAASRTRSLLVEILGGIQTVKLQNAELTARRQWEDRHLNSINQGFKAVLANTSSSNALQLINKVSSILVIGIGAWLVLRNELTLGQLIAFRIISSYVTQPMLRLASTWQSFQELSLSLERVGDVVNQPLEIGEAEEANVVMPPLVGHISASALSYSYSSTSPPVLSSVNLDVPAGSFVGLVGQSGCGKSTLLKMVPRLYRPSSGKLLIDQLDIAKVDLYSLRAQIGFVPQDCLLFEGTVFSNIALGDPQAESDRVIEMAKIACAHEFIMELPYGYSTPVGEKGAGLSGGQRQRIALARMLLENPRMVVLDEATSALDVNTERQVVNNLRAHLYGRTVLMITHRLSTLIEADQIVVMHAGRIDEAGTHSELMQQRGRYFALYQSQFGESEVQ